MLTRDFEAAVERAITDMYALFAGTWSLDQAKALLLPLESAPVPSLGVRPVSSVLCCAASAGLRVGSFEGALGCSGKRSDGESEIA